MSHLRRFEIERYLTQDLPEPEMRRVEQHVGECSECATGLAATREAFAQWSPPPLKVTSIARPQPRSWQMPAAAVLAVAAGVLLVFLIRPGTQTDTATVSGIDRPKGIAVTVHRLRGGVTARHHRGDLVAEGDRLRFEVTSGTPGYLAVVMATQSGASELWYPGDSGDFPQLTAGEPLVLPESIELSQLAEEHHVFVVCFDEPPDRAALLRAAEAAARNHAGRLDIEATEQWGTVFTER